MKNSIDNSASKHHLLDELRQFLVVEPATIAQVMDKFITKKTTAKQKSEILSFIKTEAKIIDNKIHLKQC